MAFSLSIIVPVYNVAPYLHRCLESLLCQGLMADEYEIILVDDGSTDGSSEILSDFVAKNRCYNIRLYSQSNRGVSSARNLAIREAMGDYILCVDSDDFLQPMALTSLMEKVRQDDLDMLRFSYRFVDENGVPVRVGKSVGYGVDYRDEVCDGKVFLDDRLGKGCFLWQIIARSCFFKQHPLNEMRVFAEDTEWCATVIPKMSRCTSVTDVVYNYVLRSSSVTNSREKEGPRRVLSEQLTLLPVLKQQSELYCLRWYDGMIAHTVISLLGKVAVSFYTDREIYLSELREADVLPLIPVNLTRTNRVKLCLINLSPRFYCWLVHFRSVSLRSISSSLHRVSEAIRPKR